MGANGQKSRALNLLLVYMAGVLAIGVLLGTGLVPGWGRWYSKDTGFRRQTGAFFRGSLALDKNPATLGWDMAWAEGGVQQVGGLGVPVWRLPFEAIMKVFGQDAFPDRLVLGIALALALFGVLRVLAVPAGCRSIEEWIMHLGGHPEVLGGIIFVGLFPAFLTLCRTRFQFYEETTAYAYLGSVALFIGTLRFIRQPRFSLYAWIGVGSGLIAFFRPTMLSYGLSSVLVAWFCTRRLQWRRWRSWAGVGLFCLGGAALFLTNELRFGSGLEFGHGLNLNTNDGMRTASRFGDPFSSEPILSASKELFALLFRVGDRLCGGDWNRAGFFSGQSPTFRWRELYFTAYDLSFCGVVLLAWGMAVWHMVRRRKGGLNGPLPESVVMAIWSFVGSAPLVLFYLRFPFMSSRYLVDFGPAIAVAVLACVWKMGQESQARWLDRRWLRCVLCGACAVWWTYEVVAAKVVFTSIGVANHDELAMMMQRSRDLPEALPDSYRVGMNLSKLGIPFNGAGWNTQSGETKSAVALFVIDPDGLVIEVVPKGNMTMPESECGKIQAKIGLQQLVLVSSTPSGEGRRLQFKYRTGHGEPGLQEAFVCFVAREELSAAASQFRLLRVGWHEQKGQSGLAEGITAGEHPMNGR